MTPADPGFEIKPFPKLRRLMVDGGRLGRQKHIMHGLAEVDVTRPRQIIRDRKSRTGESLSFTAFVTACLGKAVDANKYMHAYRNWRDQLVLFDEVDVNTLFEVEIEGRRVITPHIIRAVNKHTFLEVHEEIRAFQAQHRMSRESNFIDTFVTLPGFLRRAFLWWLFKNPGMVKRYYGTVAMSAVGMFASGAFWGIPVPNHTLQVTLGGITEKPGVVDGQVQAREYLSLTISIDHDVVDGAPAARFAQRLKELIESGDGLNGV
jgi:pyruvate/2-oxoglutarate dehydrogenase complex dihydrolipoamide acyltransferase (E2) component